MDDLIIEGDRVTGVVTRMGLRFHADTVVLTVGTFLGGRIHIGESNFQGGRAGDPPANALAERLRELAADAGVELVVSGGGVEELGAGGSWREVWLEREGEGVTGYEF